MKPILFNTDMVRSILDGSKTETRRVMKGYALEHLELDTDGSIIGVYDQFEGRVFPVIAYAPYRPGDILYVRETWSPVHVRLKRYLYKADADIGVGEGAGLPVKWRPSIHMPREAARIFLRVTDVRVERLQDISEEDAIKEGCSAGACRITGGPWGIEDDPEEWTAEEHFRDVWDSTIKSADRALYGWDANPWVWVIEFERCEKPGREA